MGGNTGITESSGICEGIQEKSNAARVRTESVANASRNSRNSRNAVLEACQTPDPTRDGVHDKSPAWRGYRIGRRRGTEVPVCASHAVLRRLSNGLQRYQVAHKAARGGCEILPASERKGTREVRKPSHQWPLHRKTPQCFDDVRWP